MSFILLLGVALVELVWLVLAFGWIVPLIVLVVRRLQMKSTRLPGIILRIWLPTSCLIVAGTLLLSETANWLLHRFLPIPP